MKGRDVLFIVLGVVLYAIIQVFVLDKETVVNSTETIEEIIKEPTEAKESITIDNSVDVETIVCLECDKESKVKAGKPSQYKCPNCNSQYVGVVADLIFH